MAVMLQQTFVAGEKVATDFGFWNADFRFFEPQIFTNERRSRRVTDPRKAMQIRVICEDLRLAKSEIAFRNPFSLFPLSPFPL